MMAPPVPDDVDTWADIRLHFDDMDADAVEWMEGAGFTDAALLALLRSCSMLKIRSLDRLREFA